MSEQVKGYRLESVGAYIDENGWMHPLGADGSVDHDEGMATRVSEVDETDDWWGSLSFRDRIIVGYILARQKVG
jgi:hypothetical protein